MGLLNNLKVKDLKPASLLCGNNAALQIAANDIYDRIEHAEIDCHLIGGKFNKELSELVK